MYYYYKHLMLIIIIICYLLLDGCFFLFCCFSQLERTKFLLSKGINDLGAFVFGYLS